MDQDPRRCWARGGRGGGRCRSHAVAVGDPGARDDRGGLEMIHPGSWRRCGADRGAGPDLSVHTAREQKDGGAGRLYLSAWTRLQHDTDRRFLLETTEIQLI